MTEAEELRALIREAHGVIKDLTRAVKDARQTWAELEKQTDERWGKVVRKGLDEYSEALEEAIDKGTAAVVKRFDTLSDLLLGTDRRSVAAGKPTIEEMAMSLATLRKMGRFTEQYERQERADDETLDAVHMPPERLSGE